MAGRSLRWRGPLWVWVEVAILARRDGRAQPARQMAPRGPAAVLRSSPGAMAGRSVQDPATLPPMTNDVAILARRDGRAQRLVSRGNTVWAGWLVSALSRMCVFPWGLFLGSLWRVVQSLGVPRSRRGHVARPRVGGRGARRHRVRRMAAGRSGRCPGLGRSLLVV